MVHRRRGMALVAGLVVAACGGEPTSGGTRPTTILALRDTIQTLTVTDHPSIVVRVLAQDGQPAAGVSVRFSPSPHSGSVSTADVQTNGSGLAQTVWTIDSVAGVNQLVASVANLPSVRFRVTGTAGPAVVLRIKVQPGRAVNGFVLGDQPLVAAADRFGNTVSSLQLPVTATLTGAGTLVGATATMAGGEAHFTDLLVAGPAGPQTLEFRAPGLPPQTSVRFQLLASQRSLVDRPDDVSGPLVHVIYAVPRGASDRALDTTGLLAISVASFQAWMSQTGLVLRMDNFGGNLDMSFFPLARTDAEILAAGNPVNDIVRELQAAGWLNLNRTYAVYYDGGSGAAACGHAAQGVAVMYLRSCNVRLVASPAEPPGYWEFGMLHDLFHALGAVSPSAPHYQVAYPGHVSEPNDLMYSGPGPWQLDSVRVDIDGDDYFGPLVPPSAVNVKVSSFLTQAPPTARGALAWHYLAAPRASSFPPPHPPAVPALQRP